MTDIEYRRRLRQRAQPLTDKEVSQLLGPVRHGMHRVGNRTLVLETSTPPPQEHVMASDVGLTRHQGIWRKMRGTGQIHALPRSRGRAVATNGTLIAIDVGEEMLFIGHVAWWVADNDIDSAALEGVTMKVRKTKKQQWLDELMEA
jgi:hypothetical protein